MINVPPWKPKMPLDHRHLNLWLKQCLMEITVGPGLTMMRNGQAVVIGLAREDTPRPKHICTVRVDSPRSGRAWYKGYEWVLPITSAKTNIVPTEATAGTQGQEISILNLQEVGAASASVTGHDLTHEDNEVQRLFFGRWTGQVDEENRPVVHIGGVWLGPCFVEES